jgi:hypothetical protein
MWETNFHNHSKQQANLYFCISQSLYFWIANCKTNDSAPNDSKHKPTSISSCFLHELNFKFLGLFPSIRNVPPFQRSYYLSLYYGLRPAWWSLDMTIYLVRSAFTSWRVSLLAATTFSVPFFIAFMFPPCPCQKSNDVPRIQTECTQWGIYVLLQFFWHNHVRCRYWKKYNHQ